MQSNSLNANKQNICTSNACLLIFVSSYLLIPFIAIFTIWVVEIVHV